MAPSESEEATFLDDESRLWAHLGGVRAYALRLESKHSHQLVGQLYPSFLHHLAVPDLVIDVLFATSSSWVIDELRDSLATSAPGMRSGKLERRAMREMGLEMWKSGPCYVLMASTRSLEVLEVLFGRGDIYVMFWTWVIDREGADYPIDALRRLNFGREDPAKVRETLDTHPGIVRLEEFHGPVILTSVLEFDRIRGAAERAASDLGLPFRTRVS